MYILAFETSCDDTSVALMRDDSLIALSTRTQLEHNTTGGVVPEIAARIHANSIFPCIEDVLSQSGIDLKDIDYYACTHKPGLLPSLLTGMTVAKTLSLSQKKPLIWIDHIQSHIFANYLERSEEDIVFPAVILTVSGGHTEIYLWKSMFDLEILGQTRDDAAGECFDKVAKMIGLGFPGGAQIARLANEYRNEQQSSYQRIFPEVLLDKDSLDFSFSGLKSAIKREIDSYIEKYGELSGEYKKYIAYETEEIITDILSKKLFRAQQKTGANLVLLAGGVSANDILKEKIRKYCSQTNASFLSPVKNIYSLDNAGMVGICAYYHIVKGVIPNS